MDPRFRVAYAGEIMTRGCLAAYYPHGHHLDPMTDAEIEAKFFDLAARKLDAVRVNAALRTLWEFDRTASADAAFAALAIEASSAG